MVFLKSNYESKDTIIITYDNHLTLMHFNMGGLAYSIETNEYKFVYDYDNNRLYLVYILLGTTDKSKVILNKRTLEIFNKRYSGTFEELELIINNGYCSLIKKKKKRG